MIAVDTNILVYAHRADSTFHYEAKDTLNRIANDGRPWAIPWPCFHEFISIATHPRIYSPPSSIEQALTFIENWMSSRELVMLSEGGTYLGKIRQFALGAKIAGPKIHDARIAAICVGSGVKKFYTADRDFTAFPELSCENPLVK